MSTHNATNVVADDLFREAIAKAGGQIQPGAVVLPDGQGIAWRLPKAVMESDRVVGDTVYAQTESLVRIAASLTAKCKEIDGSTRFTDEAKAADKQKALGEVLPRAHALLAAIDKNGSELAQEEKNFYAPNYLLPTDASTAIVDWEIRQHVAMLKGDERTKFINGLSGGDFRLLEALMRSPLPHPPDLSATLGVAFRGAKDKANPERAKYLAAWKEIVEWGCETAKQAAATLPEAIKTKPNRRN